MNLNRLRIFLALLLSACGYSSFAQVTFTETTGLLQTIPGFNYTDCVVDMNGDYMDDIVRVTSNGLYIDYQSTPGTFTSSSFPGSIATVPDWSIAAGDIDGNGYNDLCFGGGSRVSFMKANATGTAYTETQHPEFIFSQRTTFADIDNDGHLDAFVCHDVDQSHPYRNDGSGNLVLDTTLISTADRPGNYAAIWCDFDNDDDIDLYITKCRGGATPGDIDRTNLLYQNDGNGNYAEVGMTYNMDDNSQSWATVFEDFDNDGDFDAFTVNHDFTNRLLENDGTGYFTDTTANSGINMYDLGAWENFAADFDNDGFVDIFSELDSAMHWGNGDLTFRASDLSFSDGGVGDVNGDGFLDVVQRDRIFFNDGNNNHWIKVTLDGVQSNQNGIGSRVEIHGSWGIQIREIRSGQSFSPMTTLNAHFGIGTATSIDSLVIKWPSGIVDVVQNPAIDGTTHVIEGQIMSVSAGLEENALQLRPNPTQGQVTVEMAAGIVGTMQVAVTDIKGQLVYSKQFADVQARTLDLSTLPAGVYVVEVKAAEQVFSKKLVLQ